MKTALWILAAFALLVGVVAVQHDRLRALRQRNGELNTNVLTLTEGVRFYKTRDSLHATGVGVLELKLSEYRRLRAEDARLIGSLRVRLRRVQSVGRHTAESHYQLAVPLRDTVFVDSARYFEYRSPWVDLHGRLAGDSAAVSLRTYDTLVQVVHRVPRRFLFVRYGTKAIRQQIVSRNPHTRITYSELIRLQEQD